MSPDDIAALGAALAEKFPAELLGWRPGKASGNRALALPYIDARMVMDRLDAVVGACCWQDDYTVLPGGEVTCKLSVRIGEEWVTKMDVGAPSEQPDEGDRCKAAFSDAIKRAAVKFGIGRYLYSLGQIWADFDPQKKRFVKDPPAQLPAWALPGGQTAPVKEAPAAASAVPQEKPQQKPQQKPQLQADKVRTLVGLLDESGVTEEAFCANYKIDRVDRLPPDKFAGACQKLRLTIARNAAAAASATSKPAARSSSGSGSGASNAQIAVTRDLQNRLHITEAALALDLQDLYQKDQLRKLSAAEIDDLNGRLQSLWEDRQALAAKEAG